MNPTEARFKKKKTQWDVRLATGIHQSKISLMERGYVIPDNSERNLIAKALGVNPDEIDWAPNQAHGV